MKLMRKYKEAPTWWYMILFTIVRYFPDTRPLTEVRQRMHTYPIPTQMLFLGFATILSFPTNLTWWAFMLAVVISFLFSLPIGIIQAVTNNQIGLNVLTEFIYGYMQPGRPLALMM